MVGEEQPTLTSTQEDNSNIGIIPRALNHLFDELRLMEVEFAMRVSYLELYNEELCDLLSTDDSAKIRIYDDTTKKGSVIVQGLEEIPVRGKGDVYRLLAMGQERRRTATTLMNAQSSRSHTVFSILVHIKENGNDGEEMLKIGKLNLVDLAGSENSSKAGNEKGIRTRESVNINQSLLTLGRVITALVERTPHIPYRESKLTRLLQESLGGRTKTSIIATVSPGHKDLEETLNTLDYAHRAKNIQNKPEINQRLTKKVVLKEYTEEIDKLKRDLNAAREKNGIYLASDTYNDILYKMETQQKELNEKIGLFKTLKEELIEKNRAFDECHQNLEEVSTNLIGEQIRLRITEAELKKTARNLRKTERQREEIKHLVHCHKTTEDILTEQAKQVIEVAEEASADTLSLLASIDRRKNVEEQAITASEQLMKNLANNIIEMRHDMEQLKIKHTESAKLVIADLEDNTMANKKFASTIRDGLKEINESRSNCSNRIEKIISEWKAKTGDTSQADADKLIDMLNHMEQNQLSFNSIITGKVQAMETALAKESSENQNARALLLEKITFQNAEIDKFCSELKSKVEGHCSDFTQMSTKMKTQTDIQKQKLLEVQRLLADLDAIQNEFGPIHDTFDQLNSNLKAITTNEIKTFSEKNSLVLGEKIGCLNNFEDAHAEMSVTFTSQLTDLGNANKENESKAKESLKSSMSMVSSKELQLQSQMGEVQASVNQELKHFAQMGDAIGSIDDSIKKEGSRQLLSTQEVRSVVQQTLSGLVHGAEVSVCQKLAMSSNEIEQFEQGDVLKYRPTGETPARKDYKMNKNLAATSPHDQIIKRLRLENGNDLNESQLDASFVAEVSFDDKIVTRVNFEFKSLNF